MIKFTNVGKTYVSKSKSKVEALKDVNFELGSKGMTFILGKSGSGKSTLLNLLGGLDKPTVGSIAVDGVDMQSFKQADYESYRNSYVGFVFQEYNLLDEFNVRENIALALQLSKDTDINQKVIEALKQVELSEEYLTRRVGELSGGEKQRVAIARALVKDSRMILADEPTGNLDSETGESIWSILKNLSQTRPVIVVSHDRESAEKYADRIIEIADGKVIADNGLPQTEQSAKEVQFVAKRQRLSFAMCLKMGFNNLMKRKIRTISVILVSAFTVCALLVSQLMITFMPERSIAKYVNDYDQQYITVMQGHSPKKQQIYSTWGDLMMYSTKQYLGKNAKTLEWGYVESKQELLDFGFEFVGDAMELDDQSFYLTQKRLEQIYEESFDDKNNTNVALVNGEERLIIDGIFSPDKLVGKQVRIRADKLEYSYGEYYTVAGVIKTDDIDVDLPDYFASEHFVGRYLSGYIYTNKSQYDFTFEVDGKTSQEELIISYNGALRNFLSADNGVVNYYDNKEEFTLAQNEIVISHDLYYYMLDGSLWQKDYVYQQVNVNGYLGDYVINYVPSVIGQTVSLKFYDYKTGDVAIDLGDFVVKGIEIGESHMLGVYFNDYIYEELAHKMNNGGIIIKTDTARNLNRLLVTMRNDYKGFVRDAGEMPTVGKEILHVATSLYHTDEIYSFGVILLSICAVLAVVMVLLIISLISFSVNNRQKEIGILSAIGASVWDIIKMFILETLIMSVIIFALGIGGTFALVEVFNVKFSEAMQLLYPISFFVVDIYAILTLLGVCFVLLPLFALLPTIRIAKLKPIDAIRAL